MKKEIFIIHPSEIVRKGLNAVLRIYFNLDITLLAGVGEMISFAELKDSLVIVFTGFSKNHELKPVYQLDRKNRLHIIHIDGPGDAGIPATEHRISLEAPNDEIYTLVTGLLGQSQQDPEKATDSDLTVREKDVLNLVALGHSNKEIAEKLFISIHTVITHRKHITEKLGIKSISGLTVYAILNKIIDTDQINIDQLI